MPTTPTTRPVPFGCCPGYVGPDVSVLLRTDQHGLYRRPAMDLRTGAVICDADGRVVFDESTLPTRHHLTWCKKGFQLVRIAR